MQNRNTFRHAEKTVASSPLASDEGNEQGIVFEWPAGLPQSVVAPTTIYHVLSKRIPAVSCEVLRLLGRLFWAVGSPDALLQLQQAIKWSRQNAQQPAMQDHSSLKGIFHALDSLEHLSYHSSILRRFFLVRLLQHRLDIESKIRSARNNRAKRARTLKYDLSLISCLSSTTLQPSIESSGTRCNDLFGGRADSRALKELMLSLYPQIGRSETARHEICDSEEYKRKLGKLKTRLTWARNWYRFANTFSIGILALLPSGGEFGISLDQ